VSGYNVAFSTSRPKVICKTISGFFSTKITKPSVDPNAYVRALQYRSGPVAPLSPNMLTNLSDAASPSGNMYHFMDDVAINVAKRSSATASPFQTTKNGNELTHWLGRRFYAKYGRFFSLPGGMTQTQICAFVDEYLRIINGMYAVYFNAIAWRGAFKAAGTVSGGKFLANCGCRPYQLDEAQARIRKYPIPPKILETIQNWQSSYVDPTGLYLMLPDLIIGLEANGEGLSDQIGAYEDMLTNMEIPTSWNPVTDTVAYETMTGNVDEMLAALVGIYGTPGKLPFYTDPKMDPVEWDLQVHSAPALEYTSSATSGYGVALPSITNVNDKTASVRTYWNGTTIPNRLRTAMDQPIWFSESGALDTSGRFISTVPVPWIGKWITWGGLSGMSLAVGAAGYPTITSGGVVLTDGILQPDWKEFTFTPAGTSVNDQFTDLPATWRDYTPQLQMIIANKASSDIFDFNYQEWEEMFGPNFYQMIAMVSDTFDYFYNTDTKTGKGNLDFYTQ